MKIPKTISLGHSNDAISDRNLLNNVFKHCSQNGQHFGRIGILRDQKSENPRQQSQNSKSFNYELFALQK